MEKSRHLLILSNFVGIQRIREARSRLRHRIVHWLHRNIAIPKDIYFTLLLYRSRGYEATTGMQTGNGNSAQSSNKLVETLFRFLTDKFVAYLNRARSTGPTGRGV